MKIRVRRFDPGCEPEPRWEVFDLPVAFGESVLGVLQRIRETSDSTLAFRYGCRFKGCGLCTVEIDGRPLPACMTRAKDGMEVGPLGSFPVLRDLAIEDLTALGVADDHIVDRQLGQHAGRHFPGVSTLLLKMGVLGG